MKQVLRGWGRTSAGTTELVAVNHLDVAATLDSIGQRGAIARGLGRSYGDAACNTGGQTLRLDPASPPPYIESPTITLPGSVALDSLIRVAVPQGFFVPVTPGTRQVTIAGAIAADIHGKNHHRDGSFGNHVHSIRLLVASGEVIECSRREQAEVFWATIGGMGLTGIILDATIELLPIETSRMRVDTRRLPDLDSVMAAMVDSDHRYRYSVAWLDLASQGASLGRGVLTNAEHAGVDDLTPRSDPLEYRLGPQLKVAPLIPPAGIINGATVRAFNELWFRKAPVARDGELQTIGAYFHPLDGAANWNIVYGTGGFLQYQFVVPTGRDDVVRYIAAEVGRRRLPTFLTVLKRFGPGNDAPLSFPQAGWTLTIDVPATTPGLVEVFRQFDQRVLDAGGRHYLAKDHHLRPVDIRRGYARLAEWQAVQQQIDPDGRWQSDLSRRLRLTRR